MSTSANGSARTLTTRTKRRCSHKRQCSLVRRALVACNGYRSCATCAENVDAKNRNWKQSLEKRENMTAKGKACARLESNARQARGHVKNPASIVSDYEKGTRWAAWAFIGMFAFMSLGAVFLGW